MAKLKNSFHEKILESLEVGDLDKGYNFVFNIKKNAVGDLFIAMLKKALNGRYSIRVRGSQADRKGKREAGFHVTDSNVPLEHADRYRIYIDGIAQTLTESKESMYRMEIQRMAENKAQIQISYNALQNKLLKTEMDRVDAVGTINKLKKQIEILKDRNTKSPESFAIVTKNASALEFAQLLAFRRGFLWNNNWYTNSNQVRTDIGSILYFQWNGSSYQMMHDDDLSHLEEGTVIYYTNDTDIDAYRNKLNEASVYMITDQEKNMIKSGQSLAAVKSIKDRTGLGLKESKNIYDMYKSKFI